VGFLLSVRIGDRSVVVGPTLSSSSLRGKSIEIRLQAVSACLEQHHAVLSI
jgi:hypothetical protein